uniref:HOOK N-terminal domain-containing protein n=1 Tax=Panagrolaimus davidi TaxID=227884 RepID=A0A914QUI0_9BILA
MGEKVLHEVSAHELNKILLLLLGCAVQSEQKEHFINRIRCMRTELQAAIVGEIQKITEDSGHLLEIQSLEILPDDHRFLTVLDYLERIMKERDDYANGILEMAQNRTTTDLDEYENVSNGTTTSSSSTNGDCPTTTVLNGNGKMYKEVQYVTRSPSPSTQERHGGIENAELKQQLRRLKYDLEHKEECINICQEELQSRDEEIAKLKGERQKLISDAYAAKDLTEENEHLQEQILGLRKLEVENEQLKSKISQLSYYKNMSSQFEHDNKILQESLQMAEDQLQETKKRLEVVSEIEHKLHDSQLALKAANDEISKERDRIDELLIENGKLRREVKDHSYKRLDLERHLEAIEEFSTPNESFNDSLQSQLDVHNRSAILELKLENQKLQKQLEDSSKPGEMFELKEELAAAERKAEEKLSEIKKLVIELENAQDAKNRAETRLSSIRIEHESLTQTLNETRRQLSAVQSDLTIRKEDEILQKRVRELEQTVTSKDESVLTLEEEKKRIETQLEKTKQKQKESRHELDTLKDEYANLETALAATERSKKTLEAERNSLKARVESLEDKCDQLNVKLVNYENLERRYANSENLLIEKSNKIADLEAENRTTKQQSELEMKKAQRLREDLVSEKCRIGDLLSRLRTVCNSIRSNGGKLSNAEELMNDDEKLIDIIDDVIMQALNAARREADALRLQQQLQIAELDDLKKDIESLRRAEGELNESDDKVKELVMENKNIKEQVTLLQERLRKLQVEDSAKASELQAIKRDMEEIHNKNTNNSRHSPEIAKLQVQLRNAQLQEELHREDNVNLRKQIETAIKVKTEYEKKLNSLQATQDALIADYNRLENLHHLLGADYDRTKVELMQLKQRIKVERMNGSEISTREKMNIEATLRSEREESQKILHEAEIEISRLQKELSDFRRENCAMLRNTDERSDELRRLRVAECSQKSTINSLNGTIQQLNHVLSGKEMEIATLRRQVDMLRQYNGDENQSLIKQIELLLVKNQELHERSLNDKDTFHALQRDLQEQLVTLRRNKEKLEEKIMDQYKSMDSRKIKEKQTLMKRAAKALMPKVS